MTKDAVSGILGTANRVIRRKPRKSLQTLQLSADEREVVRPNMVYPKDERASKSNKSSDIEVPEKENLLSLRRSKRKVAVPDLDYAESPDDPKTSKSVSVKPKTKRKGVNLNKRQAKSDKKSDLNQTTLKFPPATSENKTDILKPVAPKNTVKEATVTESSTSEITEDSGFDRTNEVFEASPIPCSNDSKVVESTTSKPDNEISLITSDSPTLYYWKELAEQRRIALEKALHENESVYDQLIILEAENSQLKQLVREAENLAAVVKGVLESG